MKQLILAIFILALSAGESEAQWRDMLFPNPHAFGAHDTSFFASGRDGVFRYISGAPFPNFWVEADIGIHAGSVVIAFGSIGRYILAGVSGGAYRSSNNGSSWEATNAAPLNCFVTFGSNIYIGGTDVWRSSDSGMNWSPSISGIANYHISSLAVSETNIFAGTPSGVFRSTDSGNSWTPTSMTTATSALAVVGPIILAATEGAGIYRSLDGGLNWTEENKGLLNYNVSTLMTDGKNIFAGTGLKTADPNGVFNFGSGVFLSIDTGNSWDTVNNGLYGGGVGANDFVNVCAMGIFDTSIFIGVWDNAGVNNRTYVRSISEMVKQGTRAVHEVAQSSDSIEIYPNPSTGFVSILAGGTNILSVSVLNVLGSEVAGSGDRGPGSGKVDLDLSKLPSGTYFLQIETSKGTVVRKIVRE